MNGNLILSRKVGQLINVGENVVVKVVSISRGRVKLAIAAPHEVKIVRPEIAEKGDEGE